jgi:AraC-like DNA-binding protein
MPGQPRILASVLRDPLALVAANGGDAEGLCRRSGVACDQAEARLPLTGFVRFFQEASAELRMPGFGWTTGGAFDIGTLGPAGSAIVRAPRLGAGLRLFAEAFSDVQGASSLDLAVADGWAELRYRILDPAIWPRDQDAQLTLSVLAQYIRRAAGPGWAPSEVWFEHPPRGPEDAMARLCGAPVRFRAPCNALRFPVRVLDLPLGEAEAEGFRAAARTLSAAARLRRRAVALPQRVAHEILRGFGLEPVTQDAVAARLGLSQRTLRRRLEAEDTRFSQILAECRDRMAMRLLTDGTGIEETALRLGYADAAAFSRAFRARHDLPPGRWLRASGQPSLDPLIPRA